MDSSVLVVLRNVEFFQTAMTMQWHLTVVTIASCLTSFLICSTYYAGFGKILLARSGRNLLWRMDPFLYLEWCWITTSWHPSSLVVTLWCHIFKNVSGLYACVCSYSYVFPSWLCSGLWLCWKGQCPSYERTVSIVWKDSVHHVKGQCLSYERTVSIIWKDSVYRMKGQCPLYERTLSIIWKDSVYCMKGQCPSYERTVSIVWKDSVYRMKG